MRSAEKLRKIYYTALSSYKCLLHQGRYNLILPLTFHFRDEPRHVKISTSELVKFCLKFHACIYLKQSKSSSCIALRIKYYIIMQGVVRIVQNFSVHWLRFSDCIDDWNWWIFMTTFDWWVSLQGSSFRWREPFVHCWTAGVVTARKSISNN